MPSVPTICLAIAVLVSGTILIALGSHLVFLGDDWQIVLYRRGEDPGALLDPHVGHLIVALVVIYKLLLAAFGMSSPIPFHVASTLLYLLAAVLLFAYAKRRVGEWLALLAITPILFLGASAGDQLAPFQMFFSGSIAAGLGALLALDRDDLLGDTFAFVLISLAICFSETGLAFAVGALVRIALGSRPWAGRLWIVLVPAALYGLWWLGWGHTGPSYLSLHNVADAPRYVLDAVAHALAALLGLSSASNQVPEAVGQEWVPAALLVAFGLAALRLRRLAPVPPGVWVALAIGLAFWTLAGVNATPFREPGNERYLYPGAVFVVLIAVELFAGIRLSPRGLLGLGAVVMASVAANLVFLNDAYKFFWKPLSERSRGALTAVELVGEGNPSYAPRVAGDFLADIDAGSYLSAVEAFGSPAYAESELASAPEEARAGADAVLADALGIHLQPSTGSNGRCRRARASEAGGVAVSLPPGEITLIASSGGRGDLLLGHFSEELPVDLGPLPPRGVVSLVIPVDRAARPWRLGLRGRGAFSVCGERVEGERSP